jgi:anti-sigma regulatory factor (Ser/Thr protein kinase)
MLRRPLTPAGAGEVWLSLPARADNVAVVRQALAGVATALGLQDAQVGDIAVAVSEACGNVVVHAYPDESGPLEVEVWPAGRRLVVAVRDRGRGIGPGPRPESPGLGLGLPLIASLADEMCLTAPGPGVNEVWMTFRLAGSGRAGTLP